MSIPGYIWIYRGNSLAYALEPSLVFQNLLLLAQDCEVKDNTL